jgi:phytoene dehydrogenase-like protein
MTRPRHAYDAVVIGAGPNGLSAAVTLAREGLRVLVLEAASSPGGGARTEQLTEPGFLHDVCSAIHPVGALSPFFQTLDLERHGVTWLESPSCLAHPLDDGPAGVLERSVEATAAALGRDEAAYLRLVAPFVARSRDFFPEILAPIRLPKHPFLLARFGIQAIRSCVGLCRTRFLEARSRALFAGCAAHSVLPLNGWGTASFGLVLLLSGHAVGWPLARGGSKTIIDALCGILRSYGGEIVTGTPVRTLADVPDSRFVFFDLTPRQVARIAGSALPPGYVRRLERFRYGSGVFKIDWALDGPIPWKDPACARAATVHAGGTLSEVAEAEAAVARGDHPEKPFVLVAQQSLFDATRAPAGKHTGWAYCHVPHGSDVDMTDRIEAQIERFAPGFRQLIRGRHAIGPSAYEAYNANVVGGDIGGGSNHLMQFLFRPFPRFDPYSTPNPRLFLCSSSTPPGGGVHGMCGYHAARSALRTLRHRAPNALSPASAT